MRGAIGYVEYAYAKQNKLAARASCRTRPASSSQPDDETFQAAAAGADWKSAPGIGVVLTDQPGAAELADHRRRPSSCCRRSRTKPQTRREVLKFFDWAFKNGDAMADELDYVPLPDAVVKQIRAAWKGATRTPRASRCYLQAMLPVGSGMSAVLR